MSYRASYKEETKLADSLAPTVAVLRRGLGLDVATAAKAHALMTGRYDPMKLAAVREWAEKLWRRPPDCEAIMEALNVILGGSGVEALGVNEDGPQVDYVNMGDTYEATVLYDRDRDEFRVGCWGDEVERWERGR